MRIHFIEHVPFETPARVGQWARRAGHEVAVTCLHRPEPTLPKVDAFDWLILMGGPMGVQDEGAYPWLVAEKALLRAALAGGRGVLGICLGAQLLAEALGGEVRPNPCKEIGWFPIQRVAATAGAAHASTDHAAGAGHGIAEAGGDGRGIDKNSSDSSDSPDTDWLADLPQEAMVFHWHGDTFSLPAGARHLYRSEACANQAFQWGRQALGLQFHLDYGPAELAAMVTNCGAELKPAEREPVGSVQRGEAILATPERLDQTGAWLHHILDRMAADLNPTTDP